MTAWEQQFLPEASKEMGKLTEAVRVQVQKGLDKVAQNPLPQNEGGYGKPLRNDNQAKLAGLCKVKFREIGIRVVYKAVRQDNVMRIIVVGVRSDKEVYELADARRRKYSL
ncbi:type II toxin-antitoxin system RelE family toxin [Bifidobacterium panos]|uniref:Toxin RelE n=1 Tax=Bifidobacterium panos TaxID=2675321 RepID=A0ABX1T1E0_9BIFI|nr:type II toxin-antitoxin system RelE/ParE family toxin [Bifidobacterium sp. DSM 109963]NMN02639.1 toxin RelE [Bifidobacterium sp. DSM 109963]